MTAQTISRAMEKRDNGLDKLMWTKARHLESILPDHLDVKSFLGTAWAALLANDKLMQFAVNKPDTLLIALYRCAAKGHQPGTEEYYLTPRDGGVLGIEGYRGVIERMYRSGAVAKVVVREVCAKDYFRYVEGDDEKPVHDFTARRGGTTGADFFGEDGGPDRGAMVGVYGVAQLMTGHWSRPVLLNRNDVFAARSAGGWKPDDKYTPWNRLDAGPDSPEFQGRSMWWKTAAKRLEPWVPTSAEYKREQLRAAAGAAAAAGRGIPGQPADADEVHEAEIVDQAELPTAGSPGASTEPGSILAAQLARIENAYTSGLGFRPAEAQLALGTSEQIVGRDLTGPAGGRAHANLSEHEARLLIDALVGFKDRAQLTAYLTTPAEGGGAS